MAVDVTRYQHAAREIERFARLRLYDATDADTEAEARTLLRLAVGVRRKLDKWPPRAAAVPRNPSRPSTHPRRLASGVSRAFLQESTSG